MDYTKPMYVMEYCVEIAGRCIYLIEKRVFPSRNDAMDWLFSHKKRWWENLPFVVRLNFFA